MRNCNCNKKNNTYKNTTNRSFNNRSFNKYTSFPNNEKPVSQRDFARNRNNKRTRYLNKNIQQYNQKKYITWESIHELAKKSTCLLYTSPSPRD